MEEEPPRKRGRPITRQEDWESTRKQIRLSTSTFEGWRALKSTLALASDDAVASYLLDFLALHVHRDECSTPVQKRRRCAEMLTTCTSAINNMYTHVNPYIFSINVICLCHLKRLRKPYSSAALPL